MTEIPILLPDNFEEGEIVTPFEVLQKQARSFSKLTKYILKAEVKHSINHYPDMVAEKEKHHVFYDDFYIVAPGLENYRYSLLRIGQTNTTYPAQVWNYPEGLKIEVLNASELLNYLTDIFKSDATRQIIQSLIHQSRINPNPVPEEFIDE